ncbi:sensor histidine kinase [Clostridium sp. Marseille-QA1073]
MKEKYSSIIKILILILIFIIFIIFPASTKANTVTYQNKFSKNSFMLNLYAKTSTSKYRTYRTMNHEKCKNHRNYRKKCINKTKRKIELSKTILIIIFIVIITILIFKLIKFNKLKHQAKKEKIKLEEELKYNQLKNHFMNNISHEFRTPLNVILSGTQLLQLYSKSEKTTLNDLKVSGRISDIHQNSLRLLRLINNILDISALDDSSLILDLQNYNVVDVIENLCTSANEYIKFKDISIIFDTDSEELFALIDYNKFEKIILNLLSNAIKFTPNKMNVFVNITYDTDYIYISISDNGIGISKENQAYIFDKFSQVDTSLSRNVEGSGLGLFLVKGLINLHGGTISLVSQLNMGSTFTISLPINNSKENAIYTIDEVTKSNILNSINIEFSDIYNL